MKQIFSVQCKHTLDYTPYNQLLFFSHRRELDPTNLADKLNEAIETQNRPDEVVIAVPAPVIDDLREQIENEPALKTITSRVSDRSAISVVGFSIRGKETRKFNYGNFTPPVSIALNQNCRQIITNLFQKYGGFVESKDTYHFENPSTRHTKKFLRLSNMLMNVEEIGFLAYSCLPFIEPNTERLYIDTTSLHSVAASINEMRAIFNLELLSVNNFQSYDRLNYLDGEIDNNSIVLISATSSEGLAKEIVSRTNISFKNIVHLLYLSEAKADSNTVCDLKKDTKLNPLGVVVVPKVYKKENCEYCSSGSTVVRIRGGQFDVISTQSEPIMITKNDSPPNLHRTMENLIGTEALSIDTMKDATLGKRDYQIDLNKIINQRKFANRLSYVMKRIVPMSSSFIVKTHSKNNIIAGEVEKYISENNGTTTVLTLNEVYNYETFNGRTIIVTADVVESGRIFTEVSQALRSNAGDSPIIYLAGVEKSSDEPHRKSLKSTLTQCRHVIQHEYVSVEKIILPVSTGENSWIDEVEFYKRYYKEFPNNISNFINQRIITLEDKTKPLVDNLFLPSSSGKKLSIQRGFVFWPERRDLESTSQADVYYTVSSVLQHLRITKKIKSVWHSQTVLHPNNFIRYNDGVIRASLLRATKYRELDYSEYEKESNEMSRILINIILAANSLAGFDVLEFLLAIGIKKLKLIREDHNRVIERARESDSETIQGFVRCIDFVSRTDSSIVR